MSAADYVFLFLTDNVVATEYTRNWVMYEVGVASAAQKRLFVFARAGTPLPYPIPYVTDYTIFDQQSTNDILAIQTITREHVGNVPHSAMGAGVGALLGLFLGPVGFIGGAVVGGLLGASSDNAQQNQVLDVTCPNNGCGVKFKYYSPRIKSFNCPVCVREINI